MRKSTPEKTGKKKLPQWQLPEIQQDSTETVVSPELTGILILTNLNKTHWRPVSVDNIVSLNHEQASARDPQNTAVHTS